MNLDKLHIGIAIAAALALGLLGFQWLREHDARIRAEASEAAQKQAQEAIAAQMKALEVKQEAFLDAQNAKLAASASVFSRAATPGQLSELVAQIMGLQKPITITTPAPTAENPHPTPVAQVAVEDAPQVKAYVSACESCKINLETATQKLTYSDQQMQLREKELKSVEVERDTWKKTAQGGSAIKRTLGVMKWLAIGVAVGALARR